MASHNSSQFADESFTLNSSYVNGQISQALNLFDQIFVDIAQANGGSLVTRQPEVEIHHYNLSSEQNSAITQLYGYLTSIKKHAQAVRLRGVHQGSNLRSIPITFEDPAEKAESTTQLQKSIFILQEYLAKELNHSEKLGAKVHKLERELLQMTDERDKLLRQNKRSSDVKPTTENLSLSTSLTQRQLELKLKSDEAARNVEPDPQSNPEHFFGRYVRKTFDGKKYFGLVVSFDEYFQIVYSDGDVEDEEAKDLKSILWRGIVPTKDIESCERQAILKGLKKPEPTVKSPTRELRTSETVLSSNSVMDMKQPSQSSNGNDSRGTTSSEAGEGTEDEIPMSDFCPLSVENAEMVLMDPSVVSSPPPSVAENLQPSVPPERKRTIGNVSADGMNQMQRNVEQQSGSSTKRICIDLSQN